MISATRMGESVRRKEENHRAVLLALHTSYGDEIAKLKMQLLRYRQALIENGIEPPDGDGEDLMRMWENCKAVISAAQLALSELGTSKELLSGKWR